MFGCCSAPVVIKPLYTLRFLGGEAAVALWLDVGVGKEASGRRGIFDQVLGLLLTGDGSGVRSDSGPSPGDDAADAGEREPPVKWPAVRDLTLEALTGMVEAYDD